MGARIRTGMVLGLIRGFLANKLIVIAAVLSVTNTLAFSRCDKFSHASGLAGSALYSGGMARTIAGGMISRFFARAS